MKVLKFTKLCCLSAVAFSFSFFACKRLPIEDLHITDTSFSTADAKEWFYGTFRKGDAAKRTGASGIDKLPEWKYPSFRKSGKLEIIEFPLRANKRLVTVPIRDMSQSQQRDIATGALSRIAFIRNVDKSITI